MAEPYSSCEIILGHAKSFATRLYPSPDELIV